MVRQLTPTELAPRIPWDAFKRDHFRWDHGQHVGIIGVVGAGKTVLLKELARMREYAVVVATKPRDIQMDKLISDDGFVKIESWKEMDDPRWPWQEEPKQVVLWPDASTTKSAPRQAQAIAEALDSIYTEGAWSVFLDEGWMASNVLGLDELIQIYLLQARSLDISLILATQRPVSVPVALFDQSTWLFIAADCDKRNIDLIAEIGFKNASAVRSLVPHLERHQWLVINTRTGEMWRTRLPPRLAQ